MKPLRPGRCLVCGCTDREPCAVGCWWVDQWHVLCSRCAWNIAILTMVLIRKRGTV